MLRLRFPKCKLLRHFRGHPLLKEAPFSLLNQAPKAEGEPMLNVGGPHVEAGAEAGRLGGEVTSGHERHVEELTIEGVRPEVAREKHELHMLVALEIGGRPPLNVDGGAATLHGAGSEGVPVAASTMTAASLPGCSPRSSAAR